jgi:hypothetical protein
MKAVCVFLAHQIVSSYGIAVIAYYLGILVFKLLFPSGGPHSMRPLYWILTETPFFPVQIGLGLLYGWSLGRYLKHRSMVWVWVIPALILCYGLIAMPYLSFRPVSVFERSGGRLSHFFGSGCQPMNGCMDQLLITMPFYASVAYSIGARLSFFLRSRTRLALKESHP